MTERAVGGRALAALAVYAALAARRTVPWLLVAALVTALVAALGRAPVPELTTAGLLGARAARAAAGGAFARPFAIGAVAIAIATAFALERLIARRVAGEEAVRRAQPLGRGVAIAGDVAGLVAAAALALAALAAAAEVASGGRAEWRRASTLRIEPFVLAAGDVPALVDLAPFGDAPAGAIVAVDVFALPGEGFVPVVALALRRADAEDGWTRVEARVDGRARVELVVPEGRGALELALVRAPDGPPAGVGRAGIALLLRDASPSARSVALLAHALAPLAVAAALALALVRAMSSGIAVTLAAALVALLLATGVPLAGYGLAGALADAADGLAPRAPGLADLGRSVLAAALFGALATAPPKGAHGAGT